MSNFLLCNFKESKKFDVHSEDIIEECNIEENLLIEGEVAKNVQYSTGNFDNAPRNSLNKQRNPRKKFNTTSALYPYLPLSNFKPHDYSYQLKSNLEQNKGKNKPNSLKEEISMLLQMLASRNQNHASNQICENLNKGLNTHKEENLEQKTITMSDIECGI